TFIKASTYSEHLNPEYLRYYFASKLNDSVADIDLNFDDFVQKVNSDLIGKFVNIASRCAGFITKKFEGTLSNTIENQTLLDEFVEKQTLIATLYEKRQYNKAIREIMSLADKANQYIDAQAPWVTVKDPDKQALTHNVCSMGIHLFRTLAIYLSPVLPKTSVNIQQFLNDSFSWDTLGDVKRNHKINKFKALMQRVDNDKVEALIEASKDSLQKAPNNSSNASQTLSSDTNGADGVEDGSKESNIEPISPTISFDDFSKVDLRVAKIVNAEHVEKADKLLRLELDIGGGETRQVFAGIKSAFSPEQLIGKHTVMVANLAPRKMRFGVSEGMVLAAGPGGSELYLLSPDEGATPGMRVK
ncbi:MAG: methionine--tRNA ligase subunit beta, partial [Pseudomonadota bacterium]